MIIHKAEYIGSCLSLDACPDTNRPEFGFTGRSNVGKSSLINMLTGRRNLAKTSVKPGKTRTINHFMINDSWYLVDLPGYGYASMPGSIRNRWFSAIREYILGRENLVCLFVLIDCRLAPQNSDLGFMEFLGENHIPFARIFTKADKISSAQLQKNLNHYNSIMSAAWSSMPVTFVTSSPERRGRDEILGFIEESINIFLNPA